MTDPTPDDLRELADAIEPAWGADADVLRWAADEIERLRAALTKWGISEPDPRSTES